MVYKTLKLLTLSPRTICRRELLWEKGLWKNISYALLKGKPLAAAPLQRWSLQVSIQPRIFLPRNVNDPHCEFMSSIMHVRITMLSFDSTNQKNTIALFKCLKFTLVIFWSKYIKLETTDFFTTCSNNFQAKISTFFFPCSFCKVLILVFDCFVEMFIFSLIEIHSYRSLFQEI